MLLIIIPSIFGFSFLAEVFCKEYRPSREENFWKHVKITSAVLTWIECMLISIALYMGK